MFQRERADDDNDDGLTTGIGTLSVEDSKMPAPTAGASPFLLDERDVEVLSQSEGFAILPEHLAEHYADEYVPCTTPPTTTATTTTTSPR